MLGSVLCGVCVCLEFLEVVTFIVGIPQPLILERGRWGKWGAGTRKIMLLSLCIKFIGRKIWVYKEEYVSSEQRAV